jgi:hypothetical protein
MRLSLGWIILLLGFSFGLNAHEHGIFIKEAHLTLHDGEAVVSADVEYNFDPAALEALENGVPLTLLIELTLQRERPYWFDETLIEAQRKIQIRYHPLAKSYQIADQSSGALQNFASFAVVKDTLSRIRGWRISGADFLEKNQVYEARLSLKLDIESLPLPLRAVAYLSPAWHHSSPVLSWRVKP